MLNRHQIMRHAIAMAQLAEAEGNLPIGAVIVLGDEIISDGRNAIWVPEGNAARHAEMQAIQGVPHALWDSAQEMELYSTLEPCLMCMAAILLHRIGTAIFGSSDGYGGASPTFHALPQYFQEQMEHTQWLGPSLPAECDPLYDRVMQLIEAREDSH